MQEKDRRISKTFAVEVADRVEPCLITEVVKQKLTADGQIALEENQIESTPIPQNLTCYLKSMNDIVLEWNCKELSRYDKIHFVIEASQSDGNPFETWDRIESVFNFLIFYQMSENKNKQEAILECLKLITKRLISLSILGKYHDVSSFLLFYLFIYFIFYYHRLSALLY